MKETERNLPPDLHTLILGKSYIADNIGMSGSSILIFEDMVLKIQSEDEETRSEAVMMKWLDGKLPVPKVLYHKVVDGVEPETFGEGGFKDPQELLEWLTENQPPLEPVLSHGDFCLPNIFVEDNHVSGYIDLGKMGIADKWQDIALCYRSLKHNYTGVYGSEERKDFDENLLFEKLGIEPDWEKIRYYILMDELF